MDNVSDVVVEAPETVWSQPASSEAERNAAMRSALTEMLRQRHGGLGKKIIKGLFMRPKRRAGQPATGKGEWRGMPRKGKTQKTNPVPSAKKEKRR